MAELKANLGPYRLEVALEVDRNDSKCFVLDVGRDNEGNQVVSLDHVNKTVDKYIEYVEGIKDVLEPINKLYVIGNWNVTPVGERSETVGPDHPMDKLRVKSRAEKEWYEASKKIAKLLEHMPALKELTWIAGLPFVNTMWGTLSTSLTKLILDLGQPVRIEQDGDIEYKSYITQSEVKPLVQLTQLKELRLFRMHDSMQPVIWEAIYRNVAESGMRVLDLQMAAEPIVRANHWHKAKDVVGLTVPKQDSKEQEYKGVEGKGALHYSFGTGEYLDAFCMRKARIAAGLDETKPLPLWCLKLDGFVVDYLPFEHELSRIALLTCGNNCVDSGLRAPKTPSTPHNRWGKIVNNATSHCLIQWPNWTGVFDDHGDQRNNHGDVVPQEVGLSTPANELPSPSPAPLTKVSLHLKDLGDALDEAAKDGGLSAALPELLAGEAAQSPTSVASDVSIYGSDAPTPSVGTAGRSSPKTLFPVDGSVSSGTISPMVRSQILNDETSMMDSTDSNDSSFEEIDASSHVAAHGSDGTADKTESRTGTFKHKVRRSLGWLSGSRSGSGDAF